MLKPAHHALPAFTFAVHDEGRGLRSLVASPLRPGVVARLATTLGVADALVDITPGARVRQPVRVPKEALANHTTPLEVLHVERGPIPDAGTLQADPHAYVRGTCRFGACIHDEHHGVIFTREPAVLEDAWLALAAEALGEAPAPLTESLRALLAPGDLREWWTVTAHQGARYHVLLLQRHGPVPLVARAIGGRGRAWRAFRNL